MIHTPRFDVFFDPETRPYTSERTPHTAYPWTNANDGLVRLLEAARSAIVRMCAMCKWMSAANRFLSGSFRKHTPSCRKDVRASVFITDRGIEAPAPRERPDVHGQGPFAGGPVPYMGHKASSLSSPATVIRPGSKVPGKSRVHPPASIPSDFNRRSPAVRMTQKERKPMHPEHKNAKVVIC
jgi:hypothetical protein